MTSEERLREIAEDFAFGPEPAPECDLKERACLDGADALSLLRERLAHGEVAGWESRACLLLRRADGGADAA